MRYLFRNSVFLFGVVTIVISFLFSENAIAERVTGCPHGLKKGEFWPKVLYRHIEHKKYWSPATGKIEDLPSGWNSKRDKIDLRLGYGLTDKFDVGLLFTYEWIDRKYETHQLNCKGGKRPGSGKWCTKKDNGLTEIWISGKYKFIDKQTIGIFKNIDAAIGLGYKFDVTEKEGLKNELGNESRGANVLRIALLSTEELTDKVELCNHIFYDLIGERRDVSGWGKSDEEVGDIIGYKFFVEYSPFPDKKFTLVGGPIGWIQIKPNEFEEKIRVTAPGNPQYKSHIERYRHALALKFVYSPLRGEAGHHKKVFVGIDWDYKAKKGWKEDFVIKCGGMWTF